LEELFARAAEGHLGPLRDFRPAPELRAEIEPLLGARFARFDEEREAIALREKGCVQELLLRRPGTCAAAVAAGEIRAQFERSMSEDKELELVGAVPWGTWVVDTYHAPGGTARHDPRRRAYILSSRLSSDVTRIKKEFQGARKGWRVRLRLENDDARAVVALSFRRWIEVGRRAAQLREADDDGPIRVRAERTRDSAAAEVTVFPRDGLVLAYLDGAFLHAVADAAGGTLSPGLQIGAAGGTVCVESIRIIDRSR
ncbi:MAG TPA: hypothetical protein VEJ18_08940, partial [Planctomycetota bacterium]|nr:hypothetical protein [Planctomycetota bacterium]